LISDAKTSGGPSTTVRTEDAVQESPEWRQSRTLGPPRAARRNLLPKLPAGQFSVGTISSAASERRLTAGGCPRVPHAAGRRDDWAAGERAPVKKIAAVLCAQGMCWRGSPHRR